MIRGLVAILLIMVSISYTRASYDTSNAFLFFNHLYPYYTGESIKIEGSDQHKRKLLKWLRVIGETQKGRDTLKSILESGHTLTIKHAYEARFSAGKTIAPMTSNLTNGIGESVTVLFDASMPDQGNYLVFNSERDLIEFNAAQNLYHELAHAMHKMNGTWRYFASEKQAIEEENIFRKELAEMIGQPFNERVGKKGVRFTPYELVHHKM